MFAKLQVSNFFYCICHRLLSLNVLWATNTNNQISSPPNHSLFPFMWCDVTGWEINIFFKTVSFSIFDWIYEKWVEYGLHLIMSFHQNTPWFPRLGISTHHGSRLCVGRVGLKPRRSCLWPKSPLGAFGSWCSSLPNHEMASSHNPSLFSTNSIVV